MQPRHIRKWPPAWKVFLSACCCKNESELSSLNVTSLWRYQHAETAKLAYTNKTKESSLPRNLTFRTFDKLLRVFLTKVNLLYLLYSMAWRCCLLHLIKQSCLLKTFVRTLILMTQVSLYPFSLIELI